MKAIINAGPNLGSNTGAYYVDIIKAYTSLGAEKIVIMDCDCFIDGITGYENEEDIGFTKEEFLHENPINTFRFTSKISREEIEEAIRRINQNKWAVILTHSCYPCNELVEELKKSGFAWKERGGD